MFQLFLVWTIFKVTKLYSHIGNQDRQTKEFEETDVSLHMLFIVAQKITCDESKVLLREEEHKGNHFGEPKRVVA